MRNKDGWEKIRKALAIKRFWGIFALTGSTMQKVLNVRYRGNWCVYGAFLHLVVSEEIRGKEEKISDEGWKVSRLNRLSRKLDSHV